MIIMQYHNELLMMNMYHENHYSNKENYFKNDYYSSVSSNNLEYFTNLIFYLMNLIVTCAG